LLSKNIRGQNKMSIKSLLQTIFASCHSDEHHQRLSQQQQSGTNFDGLHPSGGGGRQSTTAMTNLPMALRRSMPSMNGGANNANNANAPPQSRHLSFCAPAGQEGGQKDEEEEEEGDLMGGNYAGGKIGERQKQQQHEARTADKMYVLILLIRAKTSKFEKISVYSSQFFLRQSSKISHCCFIMLQMSALILQLA
jgi:hypothetical protein